MLNDAFCVRFFLPKVVYDLRSHNGADLPAEENSQEKGAGDGVSVLLLVHLFSLVASAGMSPRGFLHWIVSYDVCTFYTYMFNWNFKIVSLISVSSLTPEGVEFVQNRNAGTFVNHKTFQHEEALWRVEAGMNIWTLALSLYICIILVTQFISSVSSPVMWGEWHLIGVLWVLNKLWLMPASLL